jgi:phosphoglycerate-specific signal transduction histidine kinase
MSELEFAGVKFKGGRLVGILIALSTLVGGAYGTFEVYKDYIDMRAKINSYIAPDLSGINNRLNLVEEKLTSLETLLNNKITNMEQFLQSEISTAMSLVTAAQGDARDIRNELRKDFNEVQDQITAVDKRSRTSEQDTRGTVRTAENEIKTLIQHAEDRFDGKRTAIESDATRRNEAIDGKLKELEDRLRDMLTRALNNPLAGQ